MEPSAFMRRHGDDLPAVHPASAPPGGGDPSYFTHLEYPNWMLAHIAIMVIAWVFLLPIGRHRHAPPPSLHVAPPRALRSADAPRPSPAVMLSLARARFRALVAQFVFFTANAVGLLCGTVYNSRTPDLYPNNAHHKIGWLATWVMAAQALVGLARAYAPERPAEAARPEMPVRPPHLKRASDASSRFSRDSGYGIELSSPHSTGPPSPDAESARSPERGGMLEPMPEDEDAEEKRGLLGHNRVDRYLSRKLRTAGASRAMRLINLAYSVVDRTILLLGFIALATGVVTYGGFFQGHMVFTGLAHFIKGGIFVWYGFVTLGRVMGCFAALGWSWNVKPPASIVGGRAAGAPSAEFVESLIIFLYGSTNMWLERLGKLTPEWSSTDLEHVSISIMFFGGGLVGRSSRSTSLTFADLTVGSAACSSSLGAFVTCLTRRSSARPLRPPHRALTASLRIGTRHALTASRSIRCPRWCSCCSA